MCFHGHELEKLSEKIVLVDCLLQHRASPECPLWPPESVSMEGGVSTLHYCCPEWICTREELVLFSICSLDHGEGGLEQQRLKTGKPTLKLSHKIWLDRQRKRGVWIIAPIGQLELQGAVELLFSPKGVINWP